MEEKNEEQRGVVLAQPQSDGAETPTPTADPKSKSVPPTVPGVKNSTLRNPFFWVMKCLVFKSFKRHLLSSDLVLRIVLSQGLSNFCRGPGAPREGPRQGLRGPHRHGYPQTPPLPLLCQELLSLYLLYVEMHIDFLLEKEVHP